MDVEITFRVCKKGIFRAITPGQDGKNKAANTVICSETMLTGASRFHLSPPRGFEPVSLVAGSKQVVHRTSETW
jgi:hypothetical protein